MTHYAIGRSRRVGCIHRLQVTSRKWQVDLPHTQFHLSPVTCHLPPATCYLLLATIFIRIGAPPPVAMASAIPISPRFPIHLLNPGIFTPQTRSQPYLRLISQHRLGATDIGPGVAHIARLPVQPLDGYGLAHDFA